MKRETLNANFRPTMSAVDPQKSAPTSMPVYKAIVSDLGYEGLNSKAAWPAIMPCSETCRESTPYLTREVSNGQVHHDLKSDLIDLPKTVEAEELRMKAGPTNLIQSLDLGQTSRP
jgi:hypothetical protein